MGRKRVKGICNHDVVIFTQKGQIMSCPEDEEEEAEQYPLSHEYEDDDESYPWD